MKAFRFRLQAVLTIREQHEQAAQHRYARACAAVETAQSRLRTAEGDIDAAEQAHRAQMAVSPQAGQIEQLRLYATLLHERRVQRGKELAEARQWAEGAWRQLVAATQQRESLERVQNRQCRAHDYSAACAEQKILDELVGRGPALTGAWKERERHADL
jgi:flagellar export protein FliJ